MNKGLNRRSLAAASFLAAALSAPMNLMAADGGFFSDMSWRYNGYLRAELSARTSGSENPNNQGGNVFNDRTVDRTAFLPPALGGGTWGAVPLGINGSQVFGSQLLPNVGFSDQVRRGDFVSSEDNWTNLAVFRAESEVQIKLSKKLTLIGRVRGVYDPGIYEEFDAANVRQYQGGIVGGEPDLYHGSPNYFDYIVEGGSKPNPLEWTGENYQIYFPALVLDYNSGKLNIRAGNQQIAWGQAIHPSTSFRSNLPFMIDMYRGAGTTRSMWASVSRVIMGSGDGRQWRCTDSIQTAHSAGPSLACERHCMGTSVSS